MAGHELGLSPMSALRTIHVVKGKPVLSADVMAGLALSSGLASYFRCVESTAQVATYETHRKGDPSPVRLSFTIQQAQQAGLAGGDNWRKYPDAMLRARAKAALARDVYPDALAGCYTEDEAQGFREDRSEPSAVPVAIDVEIVERPPPTKAPPVQRPAVANDPLERIADELIDAIRDVPNRQAHGALAARFASLPKGTSARPPAAAAYKRRIVEIEAEEAEAEASIDAIAARDEEGP
jgi:hypothetical protein